MEPSKVYTPEEVQAERARINALSSQYMTISYDASNTGSLFFNHPRSTPTQGDCHYCFYHYKTGTWRCSIYHSPILFPRTQK